MHHNHHIDMVFLPYVLLSMKQESLLKWAADEGGEDDRDNKDVFGEITVN